MFVYKKYNQEQLNLQYNNRFHVPDFQKYIDGWESLSKDAGEMYEIIKDIAYGEGTRECMDVFPSSVPGSKVLIFIHGGYWQRFDKSLFHFVAAAFAGYSITTVIINYPLFPAANMDDIVKSCRKAADFVYADIAQWNGDPDQIYIAGHSAGGHLAAMLSANEENKSVKNFIKGVWRLQRFV
ncbi:MAG: alpha/beta hydrolase [Bacteroidia bacterium]|nr:alpha/beta hydrolase [Bacteroidia bacterium]